MIEIMFMKLRLSQILRQLVAVTFVTGTLGFSPCAQGEPVTTIRNNGDSANRVDLVILGDGYTDMEMGKYAADVENAVQGFFAQEPFKEYQRYFNVHRVDVTSAQSGADHPEDVPPISKDTAFGSTYNCWDIERLICINNSAVNTVLNNSVGADQREMVLVLVNDTRYGGSGGSIAVASLHPSVIELVLHELGHSFGLLGDEYDYGPSSCYNAVEPPEANVTATMDRAMIKWNLGGGPPAGWIDPVTEIPTTSTDAGLPGLYEGAKYCSNGLFRPTHNSKMRNLGLPFEQINEEQLVKRIHNFVSPLDSSRPSATSLVLRQGANRVFKVTVPKPLTHSLKIRWSLDGAVKGKSRRFILSSAGLSLGIHTVKVTVQDSTVKVRNDPTHVLKERRIWKVQVRP